MTLPPVTIDSNVVRCAYSVEGDQIAIWHPMGLGLRDFPTEAVNVGLDNLYYKEVKAFIYEIWEQGKRIGILLSPDFNPESDQERRYPWDTIKSQEEHAPLGSPLQSYLVQL